MTREVVTSDGRTLNVYEEGDPDGALVIAHHGTPGAGSLHAPWAEDARERGIRLAGYDRPGYGRSSPHPNRRVADAAADAAAIADALGAERFATWGISGGAPHALACAALLGDRCVAAVSLAGIAPFDAEGLNVFRGMGEDNLVEFGASLMGREALEVLLPQHREILRSGSAEHALEAMRTLLSPPDVAALTGELSDFMNASMQIGLEAGVEGWLEDDLALTRPWGFAVEEIANPVLVIQGLQDRFVPPDHGRWFAARIPGAEGRLEPDDGHATMAARRVPDAHAWLLEVSG